MFESRDDRGSLASKLKASLEDARRAPTSQSEGTQVSPSLPSPKGGHLRASKPLEGLTQLVEGRSDFFAELAKSVGYEVQRLLRFTLLGYTNPLTAELEQKAQQQVSEGLRTVLSHLSTYVDEVFTASKTSQEVPSQDFGGLQRQLDASISQELQEVLAKSDRKLLKSTQLQNKLRSMYHQDLEAQRARFRYLLSRYLEYFTPEDLEMVHDLMNVRFFNPDSALDEDTEQLLQRKAAALQESFNAQKEGLVLQLAALSREETAMRQKLALEQKKVRLLQARMGEDVDVDDLEEAPKDTATHEEDSAGRSHMAFIKITALEDALQQQASGLQDLDRKDKSDALQRFQVLLRLCLEKAAAAKAALDGNGVVSEELLESSLERQRADLAENFAKIEESKKEAAEKELETMTQELARLRSEVEKAKKERLAVSAGGEEEEGQLELTRELSRTKELLQQKSRSLQEKSQSLRKMAKKVERLQALQKKEGKNSGQTKSEGEGVPSETSPREGESSEEEPAEPANAEDGDGQEWGNPDGDPETASENSASASPAPSADSAESEREGREGSGSSSPARPGEAAAMHGQGSASEAAEEAAPSEASEAVPKPREVLPASEGSCEAADSAPKQSAGPGSEEGRAAEASPEPKAETETEAEAAEAAQNAHPEALATASPQASKSPRRAVSAGVQTCEDLWTLGPREAAEETETERTGAPPRAEQAAAAAAGAGSGQLAELANLGELSERPPSDGLSEGEEKAQRVPAPVLVPSVSENEAIPAMVCPSCGASLPLRTQGDLLPAEAQAAVDPQQGDAAATAQQQEEDAEGSGEEVQMDAMAAQQGRTDPAEEGVAESATTGQGDPSADAQTAVDPQQGDAAATAQQQEEDAEGSGEEVHMDAMAAQQGRTDPAEEGVAESATTGQGDPSADAQSAVDPQQGDAAATVQQQEEDAEGSGEEVHMDAMAAQQGRTDPAEEGVAESATTGQGDLLPAEAQAVVDPQQGDAAATAQQQVHMDAMAAQQGRTDPAEEGVAESATTAQGDPSADAQAAVDLQHTPQQQEEDVEGSGEEVHMDAMAAQQGRTDPAEEGVAESVTTGQGDPSADAQTAMDPQQAAAASESAEEHRGRGASAAPDAQKEGSDVSAVLALGAREAEAVERKAPVTETGSQVEVSMQTQASQTLMELKDSTTQTTPTAPAAAAVASTHPAAEGQSEGGELAEVPETPSEPRSELLRGPEDPSMEAAHSGAGAPAPSSEPELREAPDAAAVVPDFRQTMEAAHERLRRFSQNSSASEAQAQAERAEQAAEAPGEEAEGSGTDEDEDEAKDPLQQSTAAPGAGRRLSVPKVPSSLERSLQVPSKSRRRRRRRIRASLRLLKAMEESGRPAGQALTMSSISDLLRSRSEQDPSRSSSPGDDASSASSSEPEVAETSAQSSLDWRSWKELPVEILEWLKVNLMQSEEAGVHGGVYEVTPLQSWPEISEEARLRLVLDFEEFLGPKGLCRPKLSKYELSQRFRERLHHSEPPGRRRPQGDHSAGAPLYEFPLNAEPVQISARLRQAMANQWSQATRDREGRQARDAQSLSWREDGSWTRARATPHRDTERSFGEGESRRRGFGGHWDAVNFQASRSPAPPPAGRLHVGLSPRRLSRSPRPGARLSRSRSRSDPGSPAGSPGRRAVVLRRRRDSPMHPAARGPPGLELAQALATALEGSRRRRQRWAWQQLGGSSSPEGEGQGALRQDALLRGESSSPSPRASPEGRFRKDPRERLAPPLDFQRLGPAAPRSGLERLESTWQGFSDRSWLRPPARPDLHGATQHGLVPAPPRAMAKLPRRPDFQKRPLGPPGPPEKFDRERRQARHSGLENYIGCVAWNYRDIQVPLLKSDFAAQMRDEAHVDADARVAAWQRHFRLSDLSTARTARNGKAGPRLPSLQARPERPRDRSLERHAVPSEELQEKGWTAR